ncbi:hypothetical protein OPT61_g447 [Boeremia exigua]|uniref:Uncharacterized protein n=1 Tax=Boeremia exigua TaxID=749465 RepID=A0ACC2ITV9_9PLEO|nr:hypothetical protein OPT61_g447 [Boeremia exigua]
MRALNAANTYTTMKKNEFREDAKFVSSPEARSARLVQTLKALAAGNHLRIAKRDEQDPRLYITTLHGASARLTADTKLSTVSNEWVIYNEFHSDGNSKHTIRLVSAIIPELFISARPEYWYDTEFLPSQSQIQGQLIKIIAGMTGNTENVIRGGMLKNPAA